VKKKYWKRPADWPEGSMARPTFLATPCMRPTKGLDTPFIPGFNAHVLVFTKNCPLKYSHTRSRKVTAALHKLCYEAWERIFWALPQLSLLSLPHMSWAMAEILWLL
jgi:hypothetical protein